MIPRNLHRTSRRQFEGILRLHRLCRFELCPFVPGTHARMRPSFGIAYHYSDFATFSLSGFCLYILFSFGEKKRRKIDDFLQTRETFAFCKGHLTESLRAHWDRIVLEGSNFAPFFKLRMRACVQLSRITYSNSDFAAFSFSDFCCLKISIFLEQKGNKSITFCTKIKHRILQGTSSKRSEGTSRSNRLCMFELCTFVQITHACMCPSFAFWLFL